MYTYKVLHTHKHWLLYPPTYIHVVIPLTVCNDASCSLSSVVCSLCVLHSCSLLVSLLSSSCLLVAASTCWDRNNLSSSITYKEREREISNTFSLRFSLSPFPLSLPSSLSLTCSVLLFSSCCSVWLLSSLPLVLSRSICCNLDLKPVISRCLLSTSSWNYTITTTQNKQIWNINTLHNINYN